MSVNGKLDHFLQQKRGPAATLAALNGNGTKTPPTPSASSSSSAAAAAAVTASAVHRPKASAPAMVSSQYQPFCDDEEAVWASEFPPVLESEGGLARPTAARAVSHNPPPPSKPVIARTTSKAASSSSSAAAAAASAVALDPLPSPMNWNKGLAISKQVSLISERSREATADASNTKWPAKASKIIGRSLSPRPLSNPVPVEISPNPRPSSSVKSTPASASSSATAAAAAAAAFQHSRSTSTPNLGRSAAVAGFVPFQTPPSQNAIVHSNGQPKPQKIGKKRRKTSGGSKYVDDAAEESDCEEEEGDGRLRGKRSNGGGGGEEDDVDKDEEEFRAEHARRGELAKYIAEGNAELKTRAAFQAELESKIAELKALVDKTEAELERRAGIAAVMPPVIKPGKEEKLPVLDLEGLLTDLNSFLEVRSENDRRTAVLVAKIADCKDDLSRIRDIVERSSKEVRTSKPDEARVIKPSMVFDHFVSDTVSPAESEYRMNMITMISKNVVPGSVLITAPKILKRTQKKRKKGADTVDVRVLSYQYRTGGDSMHSIRAECRLDCGYLTVYSVQISGGGAPAAATSSEKDALLNKTIQVGYTGEFKAEHLDAYLDMNAMHTLIPKGTHPRLYFAFLYSAQALSMPTVL